MLLWWNIIEYFNFYKIEDDSLSDYVVPSFKSIEYLHQSFSTLFARKLLFPLLVQMIYFEYTI